LAAEKPQGRPDGLQFDLIAVADEDVTLGDDLAAAAQGRGIDGSDGIGGVAAGRTSIARERHPDIGGRIVDEAPGQSFRDGGADCAMAGRYGVTISASAMSSSVIGFSKYSLMKACSPTKRWAGNGPPRDSM
jgi:hypothetical protein